VWQSVLAGGGALLLPRGTGGTAAAQLAGLGYREAVIVPMHDESGVIGTLMVAQRMGQVRTFRAGDVPLLETVANQAGQVLRKGQLLDRLGHEAHHDTLTGLAQPGQLP
jgi:GAF domain-containing protein